MTFEVSGYLGGFPGQQDNASLFLQFITDKTMFGVAPLGPVTTADRDGRTGLLLRSETGFVPAGTRSIRVLLQMEGTSAYNDGYADNLLFVLTPVPMPESPTLFLVAYGLAALLGAKRLLKIGGLMAFESRARCRRKRHERLRPIVTFLEVGS